MSEYAWKTTELTPIEKQIAILLTEGLSNKEIALIRKTSEETIKCHLTNIFDKFGCDTRLRAALYVIQMGWSTLDVVKKEKFEEINNIASEMWAILTDEQKIKLAPSTIVWGYSKEL